MKILHIATDEKFLDHAFPVFEEVYPGANDVFVFAAGTPLKYVKMIPDHIETKRSARFIKKPKLPKSVYNQYDLVIFHSFGSSTCMEAMNIPEGTPTIWLGWGFDYYKDLLRHIPLYLDTTQNLYNSLVGNKPKRIFSELVKSLIRAIWPRDSKVRAVEKIAVFAPVLPEEYNMVRDSRTWKCFPEFAPWNYGTIEDDLIKGFEGESVTGNAVLVGNCASYTVNHAEAFDLIHNLQVNARQVVVPLSYGDPKLAIKLKTIGLEYFSDNFEPLMDFMPVEDYISIIKKCGYVIMNHVRQQAVGNIVIMLYLGARVFVRQENPVYGFFKKLDVEIFTVQELEANPELLNKTLTEEEQARNRKIVGDYWSRERAYKRTRRLVERAFEVKGIEPPSLLVSTLK